jgi:hypothetical protein
MVSLIGEYKLSGMLPQDDLMHTAVMTESGEIAPCYVEVPGGRKVPQYSPTVVGTSLGFEPARDCDGNFTSSKFQTNNNCYNYACNIATNSFAQPGRIHGLVLSGPAGDLTGNKVVEGAELDGLIKIGGNEVSSRELNNHVPKDRDGHVVALLISLPDNVVRWPGDYHWVRCDDNTSFNSWSQKDSGDQITDFDFAGNKILEPVKANWKVNQGQMVHGNPNDIVVGYDFHCYMFVPAGAVNII